MAANTIILLGIVLCATTGNRTRFGKSFLCRGKICRNASYFRDNNKQQLACKPVYSLKCYTCDAQLTNANCLTATTCSSNSTSCVTSLASASGYTAIVKTCADSCTPLTATIAGISSTVTCCSTDLCNYSAGASIKSSYAAIILALGSILTILKSSIL